MTTTPPARPSRRPARPRTQGIQPIHLKIIVVVLATLVVLALLGAVLYLTLNGKDATAPIGGIITAVISGGGLFWLFDRVSR